MTRIRLATICLGIAALSVVAAGAQTPDLSGTWKLNKSESRVDPAVAFAGLGGNAGVPVTVYVTQARNGTVIVGSDMNTSRARTYRPGGESRAPLGNGDITMTSRWETSTLMSEGRDAESGSALREALSLSTDGESLRVEITVTADNETSSSTLVYDQARRESACEDWPTPCRDWSAHQSKPPA